MDNALNNPFRFNLPVPPQELVGRGPIVDHLVSELYAWNGDSHALIGGRRFGKSSLLIALEHALLDLGGARGDGDLRVLPVRFSLQDVLPLESPESFFQFAMDETLHALAAVAPLPDAPASSRFPGAPPPTLQGFEETVRRAMGARPGPLRVALLIDEMDSALGSPAMGALFGNLRSLISNGRVSDHVRLVAAGAGRFRELDGKDSPLLNVLTPIFLEAFDDAASRALIARAEGLDARLGGMCAEAAGGHPFILQFLLHHLHRAGARSTGARAGIEDLAAAEHRFLQERRPDLEAWWRAVGPEGQSVYALLSRTAEWMSTSELGRALADRPGVVQRGVEALCFHGLVLQRDDHRQYRVGGELFRAWHQAGALSPEGGRDSAPPPITVGMVLHQRYEIHKRLGKGGMGEVFQAFDRTTQQEVALKVLRADARLSGDDEALRTEMLLARAVGHPNVCRVHDLMLSDWGPILVMEYLPGLTLHAHIRAKAKQGGIAADEFRGIASAVCQGLTAIHAQGLVHGDLKPGNVMVSDERVVIVDFGFAQERVRASSRRAGAPPGGGTREYMSPERLGGGGPSAEDDVYAMTLSFWEMWTCRVPQPGDRPRTRTMRSQIMFDVPGGLSLTEIKQIFRGMNDDPQMRPQARQIRFFSPNRRSTGANEVPRDKLNAGPPLGHGPAAVFTPGAQALLVTYATHAPDVVGTLLPLDKPLLTLGRRADQDLVIPESTVSSAHAHLRWQRGAWLVEDQQSANGTYPDHGYDRVTPVTMVHGSDAQLGECRVKLVSFGAGSPLHKRALRYLARRDGLSDLLSREYLMKAIDEDGQFSDWYEAPMQVCRYELRAGDQPVSERPTIRELLALRQAAQRAVEITEMRLPSLVPIIAGRTGPLRFVISLVGPTVEEARHVVDQVTAQVQGLLPAPPHLVVTLVTGTPGRSARHLID